MLDLCLGVLGSVMDRSKSSFNILNKTFGFVKVSDVRCYTDISDKSEAFVSPFSNISYTTEGGVRNVS